MDDGGEGVWMMGERGVDDGGEKVWMKGVLGCG